MSNDDDEPSFVIPPSEKSPVEKFRAFAATYVESFRAARDRVRLLIGDRHQQSVGTHREGLLKSYFREVLPQGIAVDSGFVYGYDPHAPSRQLDILIWDATNHAAVFRTSDFVIVPPEAVVAAISVKSGLDSPAISDAMANLGSLVGLERMFREHLQLPSGEKAPSILKIVVAYEKRVTAETAVQTVADWSCGFFAENQQELKELVDAMRTTTPFDINPSARRIVDRLLPRLLITLDENPLGIVRGWGPPNVTMPVGPGLGRIPYYYLEDSGLSPLEVATYFVLSAAYLFRGVRGGSLIAAWGDFDPITGLGFGNQGAVDAASGRPALDVERIPPSVGTTDPLP